MLNYTIKQIALLLGGELIAGGSKIHDGGLRVLTDSRSSDTGKESIFFALKGPRHNGHDYIPTLKKKGIIHFVVSEKEAVSGNANFILVQDTFKSLQKLGQLHRDSFSIPVVGITGSNGKTIVKEWLYHLLSERFKIVRSPKSYNSQVGVPLSVLLMDEDHNLGLFEAGISQPGEMSVLKDIINPEIGVFTNLGDAHQENFTSPEEKLHEKLLLFQDSKVLVFSADDDQWTPALQSFCEKNGIQACSWSLNRNEASLQLHARVLNEQTRIHVHIAESVYEFTIPFTDPSSVQNACHCFAVIYLLTKKPESILARYSSLENIAMRLEIKEGSNDCLLVNDYYNSDLSSLAIALDVLQQQTARKPLSRILILSDMLETGIPKRVLYQRISGMLETWGIDELIGIGGDIKEYGEVFKIKKRFYSETPDFLNDPKNKEISSSAILIKGARKFTFEKISNMLQKKVHQSALEINLNAMANNLNVFRGLLNPGTKVMVMVKAFSYGSGNIEIARFLQHQNVHYLAVAIADEGVELRNAGITLPIVVMNPEKTAFQSMIEHQLEPNIYSLDLLRDFVAAAIQLGVQHYPVHLKIDTGMNRLGLKGDDEIRKALNLLLGGNSVCLRTVFSHLAASDEQGLDHFTRKQFEVFERIYHLISALVPYPVERHILNSAGIERFSNKQYDMVRLGIGLYGVTQSDLALEVTGVLRSSISQIKEIGKGETVGYGRKGRLKTGSKIAIVPLGYADGMSRILGNRRGQAYLNNHRVDIVGNICMDMLMIDITDVSAGVGDHVEFMGPHITIEELAEKTGTIPYEILTSISSRVKRVYLQE